MEREGPHYMADFGVHWRHILGQDAQMGLNINIYLCLYKLIYICEPRDLDSLFMSIYKQHTEACVSKESDLEMLTSLPEAEMPHSFHLTSRKTGFRKPTTPGICSLPCLADQMPERSNCGEQGFISDRCWEAISLRTLRLLIQASGGEYREGSPPSDWGTRLNLSLSNMSPGDVNAELSPTRQKPTSWTLFHCEIHVPWT